MASADAAAATRARLLECLGRLPPRPAPAPPLVDRRFVADGVIHERWRLPGPRDELVAWFLLPEDATAPAPTLLALHPHGRQFEIGKSQVAGLLGERSRAYGLTAAHAGFAVLVPDLPGFEDRRPPLTERKGNYALQGEAYERLLAMHALVTGATLQGWILADVLTWVDALALEGRVALGRMGVLGQSFGGQEAIFAMLLDDRLRAGVCSCGFSLVRLLVERRISHNLALYLPGMLPGLDFDALVPALAPRALFVIAGERDVIQPVDGVRAVEAAAAPAWAAAGASGLLRFHYYDGPHDLPAAALQEALGWLRLAL